METLGICSVTFRKKTPEEVIDLVKKSPLKAIEWGGDIHVPSNDIENARKVGELTRKADLEVSSYGSYYYAGSGESFEPYIETALALQTSSIRIWPKKMDFKKEVGKINEAEFQNVVRDIQKAARLAQAHQISLHLEFHQGTYTDSTESAERLIKEIGESNVFLYWQPLAYLSKEECLEQITILGKYISNIHVFHWDEHFNRYPLAEGRMEWQDYFKQIRKYSPHPHYFLLEFMKDNSVEQFTEDAQTLSSMFS